MHWTIYRSGRLILHTFLISLDELTVFQETNNFKYTAKEFTDLGPDFI